MIGKRLCPRCMRRVVFLEIPKSISSSLRARKNEDFFLCSSCCDEFDSLFPLNFKDFSIPDDYFFLKWKKFVQMNRFHSVIPLMREVRREIGLSIV